MQITVENDIHTLIMKDVVPEQTGEICCEAKNAVGSKKQFASLAVKMIGSAPIFEKNLEDRLVREGEEIIMEAVLSEVFIYLYIYIYICPRKKKKENFFLYLLFLLQVSCLK